ncbi:MAG: GatB/YqeY domain-containing protein [Lachnospiraceae bacterium]|nr:GatB/YqeY domain-containing protein [Lachnospiraceae bacterium]
MQIEQLRKDMMAAMKARDKERKDAISSLVSAVKKNAIDAGCREDIPEDMVDSTIMKEIKTVQEQIDSCPKDRTDLLEQYQKRYDIMKEYAPKLLSKEEVKAILEEKYADVIATKNKGQIMKTVMQELKGKADGKVINEVVTELCNL